MASGKGDYAADSKAFASLWLCTEYLMVGKRIRDDRFKG